MGCGEVGSKGPPDTNGILSVFSRSGPKNAGLPGKTVCTALSSSKKWVILGGLVGGLLHLIEPSLGFSCDNTGCGYPGKMLNNFHQF